MPGEVLVQWYTSASNIPKKFGKVPISGGDGKVFVCVEYFANKARLPAG